MHCTFIQQFLCTWVRFSSDNKLTHIVSDKFNYVFVCNSERMSKLDSTRESYAQMKKGTVFLTHSVHVYLIF